MGKALQLTGGPDVQETAKFVLLFDRFFDALNVGNFQSGIFHRKPFQLPYDSASDERLAVSVHCVRTHTFILHHYNAVARK